MDTTIKVGDRVGVIVEQDQLTEGTILRISRTILGRQKFLIRYKYNIFNNDGVRLYTLLYGKWFGENKLVPRSLIQQSPATPEGK